MKLDLLRVILGERCTIGVLRVDGKHECFILEDKYRPPEEEKVPGATAIPCGTYPVRMTLSPRFGVIMPLIDEVPNFRGVRIHPGNVPDDTEGCLLPGLSVTEASVGQSRHAYQSLFAKLHFAALQHEPITLNITTP